MERQARDDRVLGRQRRTSRSPSPTRRGEPALDLICRLAHAGVKLNVTALLTLDQVARRRRRSGRRRAVLHLRLRRTHRRYRARPVPMMAGRRRAAAAPTADGTDLGQPARAAQHLPGRRHRLPHHHRHARLLKKLALVGRDLRRVLARHGEDVPRRRRPIRVCAVIQLPDGASGAVLS